MAYFCKGSNKSFVEFKKYLGVSLFRNQKYLNILDYFYVKLLMKNNC
ncbi:hypothetical protein GFV14_00706 [Candidatus Hartigia pinicola]|nr:hypothetical protein GFV14_00706 [Candidatus Hartigia pinicola]